MSRPRDELHGFDEWLSDLLLGFDLFVCLFSTCSSSKAAIETPENLFHLRQFLPSRRTSDLFLCIYSHRRQRFPGHCTASSLLHIQPIGQRQRRVITYRSRNCLRTI